MGAIDLEVVTCYNKGRLKKGGSTVTKGERREQKRWKKRYGHFGAGASHTREASEAEVMRHIQKARRNNQ